MNKETYYVFGAGSIIDDFGIDRFITNAHNLEHDLFLFKEGMHPSELLNAFDGWRSYHEINKEQYERLKEKRK